MNAPVPGAALDADRVLSGNIDAIAALIAGGAIEHAAGMEVK